MRRSGPIVVTQRAWRGLSRGRVLRAGALACLAAIASVGCSTCPQADFMDTFFKSRNACASPGALPAPAAAPAPCGHCGKAGCKQCNPFRLFHRNRAGGP